MNMVSPAEVKTADSQAQDWYSTWRLHIACSVLPDELPFSHREQNLADSNLQQTD